MIDDLGDRMKNYENVETSRKLDYRLPIYARLDGRGFSKFTKNFERPYDPNFSDVMIKVTEFLIEKTSAVIGYTQSDEISLVWKPQTQDASSFFFDGKIQKLCSVLSGMATAKLISQLSPELQNKLPHFDCRIINMPNENETANMIAWREIDARKNAISALARANFSHKEVHGKNGTEMLKMLAEKSVYMTDYATAFRSGTFLRRSKILRSLTEQELAQIPEVHKPDETVPRTIISHVVTEPFSKIKNKPEVIFADADIER